MTAARTIILSVLLVACLFVTAEAGWITYHEPEFNGKILNIDTKQPIEGAVVVVAYQKETLGLGAGNLSSVIDVRETLTDKDGNFHFTSYTTLIQPFSWQAESVFIVFKPGYASINKLALKDYFTGKNTDEREGSWPGPEFKGLKYKLRAAGIVELPKLKTREQRLQASRVGITGYSAKDLPLLYNARNEEDKALY